MVGLTVIALQESILGSDWMTSVHRQKPLNQVASADGGQGVMRPVDAGMGMVITPLRLHLSYVIAILEVIQSLSS